MFHVFLSTVYAFHPSLRNSVHVRDMLIKRLLDLTTNCRRNVVLIVVSMSRALNCNG